MRAVVCEELGPPENLKVKEMPDPVPGPGEAVVDVKAAGFNFPDTLIVQGLYQVKPEMPFSPGGEAAGVVSAVGEGVTNVAIGDRVIAMGAYGAFAEKVVRPAVALRPMCEGMDFETAAAYSLTYGTSYYALKQRAQLQAGETLLVLGAAGGVGMAAVELGKVMGARVIAAASSDEKLEACRSAGASETINYAKEDLKSAVKSLTQGKGADVIYDPVGGDLAEQAFRSAAWNGRFLVIGFASGAIPKLPLNLALLKSASAVGVFWGAWVEREPRESFKNFAEIDQMYVEGKIKPLVSEVHPMDEFARAYESLLSRRAKGKVVLRIQQ